MATHSAAGKVPSTDVELWDRFQEMFGFGGYDPLLSEQPWHEFRGHGIAMLRGFLKRRGLTVEQAYIVACYVKQHNLSAQTYQQLFRHYTDAMVWQRNRRKEAERLAVTDRITALIEYEQVFADSPWPGRALRAAGAELDTVIEEWRQARGLSAPGYH